MKVTAVKGKAAVFVVNWGHAPFATEKTKRGVAYIPDGFMVEAKSDSQIWIAETRVNERGAAEYRFCLKESPDIKSEWRNNPTAAYKEVNTRSGNSKFATGSNGRLIIGVTYENLQSEIFKRFEDELGTLMRVSPPTEQPLALISENATTPRVPAGQTLHAFPSIHPTMQPRRQESIEQKSFKKQRMDEDLEASIESLEKELQVEQILLNLRNGLLSTVWSTKKSPKTSKMRAPEHALESSEVAT